MPTREREDIIKEKGKGLSKDKHYLGLALLLRAGISRVYEVTRVKIFV